MKHYPNNRITLECLTKKLITLLALVTAHRFQSFSLIRLQNIIFFDTGQVQIFIPENIKTSGAGKVQPCLQFPLFPQNPNICVVTTLLEYIERTTDLRSTENDYLFLTYSRPYHRASAQTLSRWVKTTLKTAGINTDIFSAYSIRHASTSAAFRRGVPIDTIRKTAGWTEHSETFFKFYNKELVPPANEFALAILTKNT